MSAGDRFLLYIDILGFAEMTKREPRKVARIYSILDRLNVHSHNSFRTIVFSDTVLVYNPELATTDKERQHLVWYLTEFAEDLHHRFTGQDVYFRAILTSGSFAHYHLDNVECFFGEALVNAYLSEKSIPSLGLFIDSYCEKFNRFFRLAKFNEDYSFVYLNRSLETLEEYTGGKYPITDFGITDQAPHTPWQVRFLQDVYQNMRQHKSPMVRTKFLTAWDFYAKRYPSLTQVLVENNFALSSLAPKNAWSEESESMKKDIKYYKRIGSGTSLSLQLTKQGKYK
ncbi:hypothetical protein C8R26_10174 [Nitrosomonas oligotropha]|uniref:Uncharacterized protein n=1 Tax=Nitrosomonas oligotropha TaxID=42354 RepID=A0A2T5I4K8_9PROT|nr:hypothetical protein [Nitrosomonas oligotropha]PTQ78759.1 hypothetical protein C8R26_10174 [Nitrosomonas oligotropha]